MNPTTTIMLPGNMFLIVASHVHHRPDAVFGWEMSLDGFVLATTMQSRAMWTHHVVFRNIFFLTTDASNMPLKPSV